jgi:glycosyltransferase involved in cell wall biosynthesis
MMDRTGTAWLQLLAGLQDWEGILWRTETATAREPLRLRRWSLAMVGRLAEARELAERLVAGPEATADDWYRLVQIGFTQQDAALVLRAGAMVERRGGGDIRLRAMMALAGLASEPLPNGPPLTSPPSTSPSLASPPPCSGGEPLRLRFAWLLPAYRPMNGPHPLLLPLLRSDDSYHAVPALPPTLSPEVPSLEAPSLEKLRRRYADLLPRLAAATGLGFWDLAQALAQRAALDAALLDAALDAGTRDHDAEFHHTAPLACGDTPWVFHFEQVNTLFMLSKYWPRMEVREDGPELALLRGLLRDPACRLIVSHVRESVQRLVELTGPDLAAKIHHVPLRLPGRPRRRFRAGRRPPNLLFAASFTETPLLFHGRGGLDVVHAVLHLLGRRDARHRDVQVTFRLPVPATLPSFLLRRLRAHPRITWLDGRLSDRAMRALLERSDIQMLPSVTLHALSLIQALRAGNVVLGADGYGVGEFLRHGGNGLIVRGRGPTRFGPPPTHSSDVRFSEDSAAIIRACRFPADLGFHIRFRKSLDQLLCNGRLRRRLALQADSDGRWRFGGGDWLDRVRALAVAALKPVSEPALDPILNPD